MPTVAELRAQFNKPGHIAKVAAGKNTHAIGPKGTLKKKNNAPRLKQFGPNQATTPNRLGKLATHQYYIRNNTTQKWGKTNGKKPNAKPATPALSVTRNNNNNNTRKKPTKKPRITFDQDPTGVNLRTAEVRPIPSSELAHDPATRNNNNNNTRKKPTKKPRITFDQDPTGVGLRPHTNNLNGTQDPVGHPNKNRASTLQPSSVNDLLLSGPVSVPSANTFLNNVARVRAHQASVNGLLGHPATLPAFQEPESTFENNLARTAVDPLIPANLFQAPPPNTWNKVKPVTATGPLLLMNGTVNGKREREIKRQKRIANAQARSGSTGFNNSNNNASLRSGSNIAILNEQGRMRGVQSTANLEFENLNGTRGVLHGTKEHPVNIYYATPE